MARPSQQMGVAASEAPVNTSNLLIGSASNRTSQKYVNVAPAGHTIQVPFPGTTFYLGYASATLAIRARGGVFNTYAQGTGIKFEKGFTNLEVYNPGALPVLFEIFIGFDEFIDNRLIIDETSRPLVTYPTYPTPNSAAAVQINDLSQQAFTDINGNQWYAISREAIYIFNTDNGVSLLLQESGSVVANGPAVAAIQPLDSLRFASSGDYTLHLGGANINAVVSEMYYALEKTF